MSWDDGLAREIDFALIPVFALSFNRNHQNASQDGSDNGCVLEAAGALVEVIEVERQETAPSIQSAPPFHHPTKTFCVPQPVLDGRAYSPRPPSPVTSTRDPLLRHTRSPSPGNRQSALRYLLSCQESIDVHSRGQIRALQDDFMNPC